MVCKTILYAYILKIVIKTKTQLSSSKSLQTNKTLLLKPAVVYCLPYVSSADACAYKATTRSIPEVFFIPEEQDHY